MIELHPTQKQVFGDVNQVRTVAHGRRWGGTTLAVAQALHDANSLGKRTLLVVPTHRMQTYVFRRILDQMEHSHVGNIVHSSILFMNGGRLLLLNSMVLERFMGLSGFSSIVIDGADDCQDNALHFVAGMITNETRLLVLGTPNKHGWFWRHFMMGLDPDVLTAWSWRFGSKDNPHLSAEDLAHMESQLPEELKPSMIEGKFAFDPTPTDAKP